MEVSKEAVCAITYFIIIHRKISDFCDRHPVIDMDFVIDEIFNDGDDQSFIENIFPPKDTRPRFVWRDIVEAMYDEDLEVPQAVEKIISILKNN
jgi:hypothetical protein